MSFAFGLIPIKDSSHKPVILTDAQDTYSIGKRLSYIEDKEKKLTLEDIRKPEIQSTFIPSKKETLNFGFSKSSYWFTFDIINRRTSNEPLLLTMENSFYDNIEIYFFDNNKNNNCRRSSSIWRKRNRQQDFYL